MVSENLRSISMAYDTSSSSISANSSTPLSSSSTTATEYEKDPLYLHPYDNPGFSFVPTHLTLTNYLCGGVHCKLLCTPRTNSVFLMVLARVLLTRIRLLMLNGASLIQW